MKILALTSIRSDYDLLSPLYKLLHKDKDIDFRLLVSGAHLSKEFGYTKQYIDQDGFNILLELETLINSDSSKAKLKTASIFLQNSIDIVCKFNPEVILFAGDREDVIMGGLIGLYLGIPTIHFYGGDHETAGHEDTVIRHATSKLSTFHFVSMLEHKKRLMKLGESKERIYNIGSISLDRFKKFKLLKKIEIEHMLNIKFSDSRFSILIYHPSPNINDNDTSVFVNILKSLKNKKIFTFVSYPNTDGNNNKIKDAIIQYKNDSNFYFFQNLTRDLFLSIFKQSSFIIGNSSAGIYEAASIPIPSINVGSRQKDRMAGSNVIFCDTTIKSISKSIETVTDEAFLKNIKNIKNIYGDGKSAKRAYNLLKSIDFNKLIDKNEDPLCM